MEHGVASTRRNLSHHATLCPSPGRDAAHRFPAARASRDPGPMAGCGTERCRILNCTQPIGLLPSCAACDEAMRHTGMDGEATRQPPMAWRSAMMEEKARKMVSVLEAKVCWMTAVRHAADRHGA